MVPKHCDQVLLEVSTEIHTEEELTSVIAPELSDENHLISLPSQELLDDVWLRGFLLDNPNHQVDYENGKITEQAYLTNGYMSSRASGYKFCYYLKMKTPCPENYSANGMSGSPVYGKDVSGKIRFAGTIIEHNSLTNEYLVVESIVLRNILKEINS